MKKQNRVWIQAELPENPVDDRYYREADERAAQMTNLLRRLGMQKTRIEFNRKYFKYSSVDTESGTFKILEDHGDWFNLEYFGREIEEVRPLTDADAFNSMTV
jgi:hypothetical protein